MEGTKIPWLSNEISSCEVSALKINIEHDANSILGLKIITQLWQRTLETCSPKHPINTVYMYFTCC